jgi:hypothetical protein
MDKASSSIQKLVKAGLAEIAEQYARYTSPAAQFGARAAGP